MEKSNEITEDSVYRTETGVRESVGSWVIEKGGDFIDGTLELDFGAERESCADEDVEGSHGDKRKDEICKGIIMPDHGGHTAGVAPSHLV